jgi:excisionase family DNA binding protein
LDRITLTAEEAAKYVGVSYWKLLELVRKGEIPNVKVGRRILFRSTTLNDWMDHQEKSSTESGISRIRKLG